MDTYWQRWKDVVLKQCLKQGEKLLQRLPDVAVPEVVDVVRRSGSSGLSPPSSSHVNKKNNSSREFSQQQQLPPLTSQLRDFLL